MVQPDCILWTGPVAHDGYGVVNLRVNGKGVKRAAHREAWQKAYGPIPEGASILHSCDTPLCVNPAHLRPGTQAENIADMMARGRHLGANSTHCHRGHEFTEENTRLGSRGQRVCRKCAAIHSANYRKRRF